MNNITVKSLKDKSITVLRYENGVYTCPKGHVVYEIKNNRFVCQICNEAFSVNRRSRKI